MLLNSGKLHLYCHTHYRSHKQQTHR